MPGLNYKHFERMAALLLALADLAERAGRACAPVRCFVLWLLRWAQAAAVDHAADVVGAPFWSAECRPAGDAPDDALLLAKSLRALAAVFQTLAQLARLADKSLDRPIGFVFRSRCPAADYSRPIVGLLARFPDTS